MDSRSGPSAAALLETAAIARALELDQHSGREKDRLTFWSDGGFYGVFSTS